VCLCVGVCVCAHVSLCVRVCLNASVPDCLPACMPPCLRACMPPCLHACMPADLRACVPACLRACELACVPSRVMCACAPACLRACKWLRWTHVAPMRLRATCKILTAQQNHFRTVSLRIFAYCDRSSFLSHLGSGSLPSPAWPVRLQFGCAMSGCPKLPPEKGSCAVGSAFACVSRRCRQRCSEPRKGVGRRKAKSDPTHCFVFIFRRDYCARFARGFNQKVHPYAAGVEASVLPAPVLVSQSETHVAQVFGVRPVAIPSFGGCAPRGCGCWFRIPNSAEMCQGDYHCGHA
jgi:hypothetical protein